MNDEQLISQLAALPKSRQPKRDLWPGIAAGIGQPTRASSHTAPSRAAQWRGMGFATAALLVICVGISNVTTRLSTPGFDTTIAANTTNLPQAQHGRQTAQLLELEYGAAREVIAHGLQQTSENMLPAEHAMLAAQIAELDAAAEQIRHALAQQPDAIYLASLLQNVQQRQLDTLSHYLSGGGDSDELPMQSLNIENQSLRRSA